MSSTIIDKEKIIQDFVRNFVLKERRDRTLHELNHSLKRSLFIRRLHHTWATVLDMRKLTLIPKEGNQFVYAQNSLALKDKDLVYMISDYGDLDDRFMKFKEGFEMCKGRGLATLIISINADKLYLETEQEQGAPDRFIGKAFLQ